MDLLEFSRKLAHIDVCWHCVSWDLTLTSCSYFVVTASAMPWKHTVWKKGGELFQIHRNPVVVMMPTLSSLLVHEVGASSDDMLAS